MGLESAMDKHHRTGLGVIALDMHMDSGKSFITGACWMVSPVSWACDLQSSNLRSKFGFVVT